MTGTVFLTQFFGDDGVLDSTGLILTVPGAGTGRAKSPPINRLGTSKSYAEFTCHDPANDPVISFSSNLGTVYQNISVSPLSSGPNVYKDHPTYTMIFALSKTWVNGDVLCFAHNAGTGDCWFRVNAGTWNGSGTANPATGVGGVNINPGSGGATVDADFFALMTVNSSASMTANFGLNYTYTPPAGFAGWNGLNNGVGPSIVNASGTSATGFLGGYTATAAIHATGTSTTSLITGYGTTAAIHATGTSTTSLITGYGTTAAIHATGISTTAFAGSAGAIGNVTINAAGDTNFVSSAQITAITHLAGTSNVTFPCYAAALTLANLSGLATTSFLGSRTIAGLQPSYSSASVQMLG